VPEAHVNVQRATLKAALLAWQDKLTIPDQLFIAWMFIGPVVVISQCPLQHSLAHDMRRAMSLNIKMRHTPAAPSVNSTRLPYPNP
jgi:hypothetical protein